MSLDPFQQEPTLRHSAASLVASSQPASVSVHLDLEKQQPGSVGPTPAMPMQLSLPLGPRTRHCPSATHVVCSDHVASHLAGRAVLMHMFVAVSAFSSPGARLSRLPRGRLPRDWGAMDQGADATQAFLELVEETFPWEQGGAGPRPKAVGGGPGSEVASESARSKSGSAVGPSATAAGPWPKPVAVVPPGLAAASARALSPPPPSRPKPAPKPPPPANPLRSPPRPPPANPLRSPPRPPRHAQQASERSKVGMCFLCLCVFFGEGVGSSGKSAALYSLIKTSKPYNNAGTVAVAAGEVAVAGDIIERRVVAGEPAAEVADAGGGAGAGEGAVAGEVALAVEVAVDAGEVADAAGEVAVAAAERRCP